MAQYKLINNADGNIEIPLASTIFEDAVEEGFEALGYTIFSTDEETRACDTCGKEITESDYEKGQGLCTACIEAIN